MLLAIHEVLLLLCSFIDLYIARFVLLTRTRFGNMLSAINKLINSSINSRFG